MSTLLTGRLLRADDAEPQGKPDVWLVYWIFPVWYTIFGVIIVVLTRVTPPPRPDVDEAGATAFFADHALTIQIGFTILLVLLGGAALTNGLIFYHMRRMSSGSVFAYGYIAGMAVGALPGFLLISVIFLTATLRPDRNPEQIGMLYDLGLLSYNGSLGCFTAAYFALAVAIFYDKNEIFPKWFAYMTIWQIVTEVIASQMFVFKSGPFAWNGSIALWWAVVVFTVWLSAIIVLLRFATAREPVKASPQQRDTEDHQ